MPRDQIFMGAAISVVCLVGLLNDVWLLANTRKGRWLAERFGERRARLLLRCGFVSGIVAGALLAASVIAPVRWG